jgi:hypothetical protein
MLKKISLRLYSSEECDSVNHQQVRCVVNFTVLDLEPIGAHNPQNRPPYEMVEFYVRQEPIGAHNPQNRPPYEMVEFYVRQEPKRDILLPDMLYTCMLSQHESTQFGNVMYIYVSFSELWMSVVFLLLVSF